MLTLRNQEGKSIRASVSEQILTSCSVLSAHPGIDLKTAPEWKPAASRGSRSLALTLTLLPSAEIVYTRPDN